MIAVERRERPSCNHCTERPVGRLVPSRRACSSAISPKSLRATRSGELADCTRRLVPSRPTTRATVAAVSLGGQNAAMDRCCCFLSLALLLILAGCKSEDASTATPVPAGRSETEVDWVAKARRAHRSGDHGSAADSIYKHLLAHPDDSAATFLAAQIESARKKPKVAIDLCRSIPLSDSRFGLQAMDLRCRQLLAAGLQQDAEQALVQLLEADPENAPRRHDLWELLNRLGRRQEACQHADYLCRQGFINDYELLSLVRRTLSFPFLPAEDEDPRELFAEGLGRARWHFSRGDLPQAIDALQQQSKEKFEHPAAAALYGRLLAESQRFEQMPAWHEKCNDHVQVHSDYWAALGVLFIERGQHEAAVGALLRAIDRDPTDRVSFQRLGRVFHAMGREDDAEQAVYRGVKLGQTEDVQQQVLAAPSDGTLRQRMVQQMIELGRPFEALQWKQTLLPPQATAERRQVETQRRQLAAAVDLDEAARRENLMGHDPADFPCTDQLHKALGSLAATASSPKPKKTKVLAQASLVNVSQAAGLNYQYYHRKEIDLSYFLLHETVGGGIGVIDFDLDGWPDLYLAQGSGDPPDFVGNRSNQLLRNVEGKFQVVTTLSGTSDHGYSTGVAVGDVNQDGFADIYLGNLGRNRLLINNGDGTFTDASGRLLGPDGQPDQKELFSASLAIADIDRDHLPDLFESNYVETKEVLKQPRRLAGGRMPEPSPLLHFAQPDRWFRQRGDGRWDALEIGVEVAKPASSLGVMIAQFDSQPGNEVFVGNDVRPNHYLSFVDGNLRNLAAIKGIANGFDGSPNGCMGIAIGDFDRDGRPDIQIANFLDESANLFIQRNEGVFVDLAVRYGLDVLTKPYLGFGTKAVDIDRNGWLDFVTTNGHIFDGRYKNKPFRMSPQLVMGLADRFEVSPVDDPSGYWNGQYLGRTIATTDFDRDRRIDFVINHLDAETALLQNQTETSGHWIQLELVGSRSERDAIGAQVTVTCDGESFHQWVTAGDGYFCSDQPLIDIGLEAHLSIDSVTVRWPFGENQVFENLQVDQRYLLIENQADAFQRNSRNSWRD